MGENLLSKESFTEHRYAKNTSMEHTYPSEMVKSYIEQRKEKAEKQKQDEKNGISNAKLSEQKWDEMQSYRYAIF